MEIDTIPTLKLKRTRRPKIERMREAVTVCPASVIRELNNRSLFHFIKYFWSEICNDEFKPNWHIEQMCLELEQIAEQVGDRLPKLYDIIFNIPSGETKTIICSIMFPAWCWTKWYWMRFITASYSAALSLESAEYSRDLIRSEKFRMIYPELEIKEDKDTKSNFKVVKKEQVVIGRLPRILKGGNRYSTSVGGTLMGFHGHILIVDDPLNPNQAASEKELANAAYWMDQTLPTRKTDKEVTPTILIMQRLHQNDPSGHWLDKQKKNVRHISLPGEIRNYRKQLKPAEWSKYYKDDLMDVVRLPWHVLRELEADLGQYGYAGQIGQKPTPPGGGMFKVEHFQIVDTTHETNIVQWVRYWDKAGTEGAGAYTAGVKIGSLPNGVFIVADVKRGQWASEQRERIIKETAEADGQKVLIGIEQEPGSAGKDVAQATIRNLVGFSVYAECPTGNKEYRADPLSVQVNNGNVRLLRGDWNHAFIEEFRNFPFSTYKDQVDAGSGGFNRLTAKKIARRIT